jgi:hypothetical protein
MASTLRAGPPATNGSGDTARRVRRVVAAVRAGACKRAIDVEATPALAERVARRDTGPAPNTATQATPPTIAATKPITRRGRPVQSLRTNANITEGSFPEIRLPQKTNRGLRPSSHTGDRQPCDKYHGNARRATRSQRPRSDRLPWLTAGVRSARRPRHAVRRHVVGTDDDTRWHRSRRFLRSRLVGPIERHPVRSDQVTGRRALEPWPSCTKCRCCENAGLSSRPILVGLGDADFDVCCGTLAVGAGYADRQREV